jgi:hypothetical protein
MVRMIGLLMLWLAVLCYADTVSDESYELYSSIYKNSPSLEADEIIGIAAEAVALHLNEGCLKPGTEEERKMVEAARAAAADHAEWQQRFDLGHPYRLIPSAEKNRAIDCVQGYTHGKPLPGCDAYLKMRYVRFFSVPIFNGDHTRALVSLSRVCGGLCGDGSLRVYRKIRGGWEQEPDTFAKCVWMY